jgi:hypothetical protein
MLALNVAYRYEGDLLDYKIGRAMFETTAIPDHWKARLIDQLLTALHHVTVR